MRKKYYSLTEKYSLLVKQAVVCDHAQLSSVQHLYDDCTHAHRPPFPFKYKDQIDACRPRIWWGPPETVLPCCLLFLSAPHDGSAQLEPSRSALGNFQASAFLASISYLELPGDSRQPLLACSFSDILVLKPWRTSYWSSGHEFHVVRTYRVFFHALRSFSEYILRLH